MNDRPSLEDPADSLLMTTTTTLYQRSTVLGLSLCMAPLLTGCQGSPAASEPPPPKVTVSRPEVRELIDYDEYNGRVAASEMVEVRSRVRGHIIKVNFIDGEVVEPDQLLFELDPQPFQAEIGRARGQLEIAKAQLEKAEKEEERNRSLVERMAGTQQLYEQAIAERKTWNAQVLAAQDEVRRKELDAEYARITAPIGGRVGRALLTKGNLVNAGGGDPLLTTIVALNPIHVYFNVDERSLFRYRQRRPLSEENQGKPLSASQISFEFRLETEQGFPHRGLLDFADNRIDPETGTIEVRGSVENPDKQMIPGSRVRVRVAVSDPYQAMLVPDTAVLSDLDKKYLLYLNSDNVVLRRDVHLGKLQDDGMRVILPSAEGKESLKPDDRVVVLGLQRARVNYPVEPLDTAGKPVASGPVSRSAAGPAADESQ